MNRSRFLSLLLIGLMVNCQYSYAVDPSDTTRVEWKPGYLDIHHIHTGSGSSAFFVLPDGTTMLVDAGDIGDRSLRTSTWPLTSSPPYPDDSKTAGEWIVDYIKQVLPHQQKPVIDYALITHFHDDHMGKITTQTKTASNKAYKLSGITAVGDLLPIKTLIDRNYPAYDFPTDLTKAYQAQPSMFLNYQAFIQYQQQKNGMKAEQLAVGSTQQIKLKYNQAKYPGFMVRGIKTNGTFWTGKGDEAVELFNNDSVGYTGGYVNENPFSLAIKLSYGKFDYFTGGDNTGLQEPGIPHWADVETPMSKVVGKVEVTSLCHHGVRDAVNQNFLANLQPQTLVQQSWSSNHPGEDVVHRMINKFIYDGPRNIFATHIQDVTKTSIGFWLTNNYKSTFGHIIIRVLPGGDSYYVLIAETIKQKVEITKVFGPYECKD